MDKQGAVNHLRKKNKGNLVFNKSLQSLQGCKLDAEVLLENYAVTKHENMALGSTDKFSREKQSEANLHLPCLISAALYRFEF